MRQYSREERLNREKKNEQRFTVMLRLSCALISILIIAGLVYFLTAGGIEEWNANKDFREFAPKLFLAILGLFIMTTTYALKGDKSVRPIRKMFTPEES